MKAICRTYTLVLGVVLAFAIMASSAQNSWTNRYNGPANGLDQANAIVVDSNGNVFVAGISDGGGSSFDYATIKYSNNGLPLWTNRYNGPGNGHDAALAIALDSSGNVIVTGYVAGAGTGTDYSTIKYSNEGEPFWTNQYVGTGNFADFGRAVVVDGNNNVFVTGQSTGTRADFATIKYSSDGLPLWTNRYNDPTNAIDNAKGIAVDKSGNVFVTGIAGYSTTIAAGDYLTIKYSNVGVPLWTNSYSGPGNHYDEPSAIVIDSGGSVFVTGRSGESSSGYLTIKYSNSGVPQWTNHFAGSGNGGAAATAIAVDGDDNVFVTGSLFDSFVGYEYATIKYSNDGVLLWTNLYNGPGNSSDRPKAIAVDKSGNVFVTGQSVGSGSGGDDYATVVYSNDGVPMWTNRYNGTGNGTDQANAIAVDGSGNVFVTGRSFGDGSNDDYVTIKYAAPPRTAFLENPQVAGSEFSFHLVAEPDGQFTIQVSTNLVNWEAIRQVTIPAGGSTNIVDLVSSAGQKYYRAQRQ